MVLKISRFVFVVATQAETRGFHRISKHWTIFSAPYSSRSTSYLSPPHKITHTISANMSTEKEVGGSEKKASRPNSASERDEKEKKKIYPTRGNISAEQQKRVESKTAEILSLSIAKKRELYKCKKYIELKDVPTWPDYYSEKLADSIEMTKWLEKNKKHIVSDVNDDLNSKISIFIGDITTLEIDAIVNAANESLLGGGGVDGVIHRCAGKYLLKECELLNGCVPGDAKITCGYNLPAKSVIHTVGPRGEKPDCLESCYKTCLDIMKEKKLKTVAIPCISTGIFGYPNLNAAKVVLKTVRNWLETDEYSQEIERIIFCLFLEKDVDIYNEQMQLFFPLAQVEEATTSL